MVTMEEVAVGAGTARGRPRRGVDRAKRAVVAKRRLMKPAVTGSPIYYRSARGGSWQLDDLDLLFALDLYDIGKPIAEICEYFGISRDQLYRNISPYLQRR